MLEFRVFDVLQNKENEKFLDKVKSENPDLYSKFLNIVGNKGLEKAKEKYQQYDPEFIKSEKNRKKKEKTKEFKEQRNKNLLEIFKDDIKKIRNLISNHSLKNVAKYINGDDTISDYLKSLRLKKKYRSYLSEFLRNPNKFKFKIQREKLLIESLIYLKKLYHEYEFETYEKHIITITQYYVKNSKGNYLINFEMPLINNQKDIMRGEKFTKDRIQKIEMLSSNFSYLTEQELYNIIDKYSYYLSDKYYEDWKIENDASRYNI